MIDFYYDVNLLYYYVKAISVFIGDEKIFSSDILIDILAVFIQDVNLLSILNNLKEAFSKDTFTSERQFALTSLIHAFEQKRRLLADEHYLQNQLPSIPTIDTVQFDNFVLKTEKLNLKFNHNINNFIEEQLIMDNKYGEILKLIANFEKDLKDHLGIINKELFEQERKYELINKSLSIVTAFRKKEISLPKFHQQIYRRYDISRSIPPSTYSGWMLGWFGKLTPLSHLLYNFDTALTKNMSDLHSLVTRSRTFSVYPSTISCEPKP